MGKSKEAFIVLELPPQKVPVRFIVQGIRPEQTTDDDNAYYYEQHTCATNWLGSVTEVYHGDEIDPHGIFRYVKAFDTEQEAHNHIDPEEPLNIDGSVKK